MPSSWPRGCVPWGWSLEPWTPITGSAPMTDGVQTAAAPTDPAPARPRRRPLIRSLRLLGGLFVQLVLAVLVVSLLVLGTQPGLRAALGLAEDLAPGVIRVGKVEGRVLGRLHLEDLEVHLTDLDLRLGSLELDWSPLSVFGGTLRVARLAARDLDIVTVPGQEREPQPIALPQIGLPVRVAIDEILVERLRVLQRGSAVPVVVLDRALLAGGLAGSDLDLLRLELDLSEPRLAARVEGRMELRDQYPLDLRLDWDLGLGSTAQIKGRGQLSGDFERLVMKVDLSGSAQVELDAQVQDLLGRPNWEGLLQIKDVRVPDFQAGAPEVAVRGRLETRGDLDAATLTGTLEAQAPNLPDFGRLEVELDAAWKDRALALRTLQLHESVSGAVFKAAGGLDLKPNPGTFQIKGAWERLRWPLSGALVAAVPRGRLNASGTFDAYDYAVSAAAEGLGFPAIDLDLKGSGNATGTRIAALALKTLGGTLEVGGDLAWAPALAWDLKLRGRDLNPAGLAPGLDDRISLALDSKGGLDGFGYDLLAGSQGPGLPPARLSVGGTGDGKGTVIETLRLDALKGRIAGRARAGWDPQVTWAAELTADGIDPGAYAFAWPGRIDGRIRTQGTLEATGPNLTAALEGVQGTLRGYPIAATGQVGMAAGTLRVEDLTASSGPSVARVDGTLAGETLDLRFELASPDLASLLPQAKGSVQATGRVAGTMQAPRVRMDLSAKGVEAAGQRMAGLTGNLDLALTPTGPLKLELDATGLAVGALRWDSLKVRGAGSMPSHRLNVVLTGEPLAVRLEANGGLQDQGAYQGALTRLELDSQPYGNWRLQKTMPVALAGPRIAAGPLCLRNGKISGGCVGFNQTAVGQWTADIDLDKLGFELLQGLLPENQSAEGAAQIKGRFQAAGPVLTGNLVGQIPNGRIRLMMAGGRSEVLDFSKTRLTLDAGTKGLGGRLAFPLKGWGEVSASAELPGWRLDNPARPDQPLRGGLKAKIDGLARLAQLVPDLTGVTGSIAAELSLSGTLGKPGLKGDAALRKFGAEVPLIGLKIAELNINLLASSMERVDLQGQGQIGGGRLELSGDARLGPAGLAGRFMVAGDKLKIADTKEYFALVSPRIQVDLTPPGARVSGEISVPEARIRPRTIPAGTVSASPDVVLVDQAGAAKSPFPIDIDLRLKLGDNVTLDAFGVRGRLTGDLRVVQTPGKEMLGDGQLAIVDGIYRFSAGFGLGAEIGAPLTIEQGRLVYAMTPIGNPGLLLQAQRETAGASAGVRVLGNIRKPKLAFFSDSDPNLSQAEITKYLLTGIAPRSDSAPEDQTVAVGTYVAPKLFVEYESGIGDRKDAVKLRYDWSRNIELQTETGENPGGDIFYKFER